MASATTPQERISDNYRKTRAIVRPKVNPTQIGTIEIDVCREETHTLNNTVTDHPVEEGSNISDHSRPEPDQVNLTCFVSNTPLSSAQQQVANNQSANSAGLLNEDGSVQIVNVPDRGNRVFDALKKLRDEGTLIKVVTTLRVYGVTPSEGMMITGLTVPRKAANFDGLEFTLALKQVRIVRNRSSRQKNKEGNTHKKQSKGDQTPQGPKELESGLSKSGTLGRGEYIGTQDNP